MDGIQGAVLSVKLRSLDKGNDLRRRHANRYGCALKQVEELSAPREASYAKHVYHVYAVRVREREEVMRSLEQKGIGCGIHYPVPVHLQEAYQSLGHRRGAFEISERTSAEFISLPMFPELTSAQIDYVIEGVQEALLAVAVAE